MFQLSSAEMMLRLEHKHADGSWGSFEPQANAHDVAAGDPEREWAKGHIFKCKACDEEIRISEPSGEAGKA